MSSTEAGAGRRRGRRGALATLAFVATATTVWLLTSPAAPPPPRGGELPVEGGAAGLGIAPVRAVVTADAATTTLSFSVANESSETTTYRVTAGELNPETGTPLSGGPADAAAWVTVPEGPIEIPARTARPVSVEISPPDDRGASQRRIGITFAADPRSDAGTTSSSTPTGGVSIVPSITASVYVEGTGPVRRAARIESLSLPWAATSAVRVRASVQNNGTVNVVPGATDQAVIVSASGGSRTQLNGPLIRVDEVGDVVGELGDLPAACWCEVRVDALVDGEPVSTVSGRVLVLPTFGWIALVALLAGGLVVAIVLTFRRVVR